MTEYINRKSLKSKRTPSLEPIKEEIRKMKRENERMRVGKFFYCDECKNPIYQPSDGFVIHGNVYTADPTGNRKGLIGNNFPEGETMRVQDVKETVLCKTCFFKVTQPKKLTEKSDSYGMYKQEDMASSAFFSSNPFKL